MKTEIGLETYDEEGKKKSDSDDNILSKFGDGMKAMWNKTVFPDKIKARKQEKEYHRKLREQAKIEAQEEIKEVLKEKYKEEEIQKAKGIKKKSNVWNKLAKGFEGGNIGSNDKIGNILGGSSRNETSKDNIKMGTGNFFSDDKINRMLGKVTEDSTEDSPPMSKTSKKKTKQKKTKQEKPSPDPIGDKIKRMLG